MKIQFFNHACFSIENENILLLNDPYLSGTAFNNGWDLILDNINFTFDLSKKNYIYYSHEHPDHFSIQFLQSINEEDRKSITILYQKTKDGKVKNFVKKLGFNVIEVSDKEKYKITDKFSITIGQIPFYDSWSYVEINDKKILNVNDCILENPNKINEISKHCRKVDILFTQYSYANWVEGGFSDNNKRKELANKKLEKIRIQSEILCPEFIVPFASMIRFCHEENKYMNDSINTPRKTIEYINSKTSSKAYLMKPYEIWNGSDIKNNEDAMSFWDKAYENALKRDLIKQEKFYEEEDIQKAYSKMVERVKSKNNIYIIKFLSLIGIIPSQIIKILDLNKIYYFSWHKGLKLTQQKNQEFVEMTSDSLHFLLSFDYGIDTLNVNARFKGSLLQKKNIIRTFSTLALNNMGRFISFKGILSIMFEPSFIKKGLKSVGLFKS